MLAIGIDPGTAICGFGLVEMVGNKLTPIHYGAVLRIRICCLNSG